MLFLTLRLPTTRRAARAVEPRGLGGTVEEVSNPATRGSCRQRHDMIGARRRCLPVCF